MPHIPRNTGAPPWRATVITLFPEMFPGPLGVSLAGQALAAGLWSLSTVALREHGLGRHRAVDDAPADFLASQVKGIVGIEIEIAAIEGKWKVSQNRPAADQAGVVAGLGQEATPGAAAMAALVAERLKPS